MEIFISYSWDDTLKVDKIQEKVERVGITIIRDVQDFKYKESLPDFMQRIRTADYALVYISDKFLKSANCMNEMLELQKELDYNKKILPIVDDDLEISNPTTLTSIIRYWEKEIENLKVIVSGISPERAISIYKQIDLHSQINQNIDSFIHSIIDNKYLKLNDVINDDGMIELFSYIGIPNKKYIKEAFEIIAEAQGLVKVKNKQSRKRNIINYIHKYPELPYGYYVLGTQEINNKSYVDAVDYFETAIMKAKDEDIPIFKESFFRLALANALCSQYNINPNVDVNQIESSVLKRISTEYETILEASPNDINTIEHYGVFLANIKNHKHAIELFSKGVELNPMHNVAHYNLGNQYLSLGIIDKAIESLSKSIELNSSFEFALSSRAKAYDLKGDFGSAISDITKAIELNSNNENYFYKRASYYKEIKKYTEALEDFNSAIRINPKNVLGINERGKFYAKHLST